MCKCGSCARALKNYTLVGIPGAVACGASGVARVTETAAHEGALAGGGRTIAVLGCGVDVLYPPEAGRLRDNILGKGAIISEFPPGTKPLPRRFPARNRLISGMAQAGVGAAGPAKSGAPR